MDFTWTCDVCGAEHIILDERTQVCDHKSCRNIRDGHQTRGRTYIDFDKYPSFVANPGSTVHDCVFDEVHEYRRFYRAYTGRPHTPWGTEADSANDFIGTIVRSHFDNSLAANSEERDARIKKMSRDLIGPWTYWAIKVTAWATAFIVAVLLLTVIVAMVR